MAVDPVDWPALCRAIRGRRHWTQVELARALGSARSAVTMWEAGHQAPSARFAWALHELWDGEVSRTATVAAGPFGNVWTEELPPIVPGDLEILPGKGCRIRYRPAGLVVRAATWSLVVDKLWLERLWWWRGLRAEASPAPPDDDALSPAP